MQLLPLTGDEMDAPAEMSVARDMIRPVRRRTVASLAAEAAFRTRLKELGAILLEPEWLGAPQKHRARCREGHECHPRPDMVLRGRGICITCAGKDPAAAEAAFRARLAELGAELLQPYVNSKTAHHVRCAAGHACYARPNDVQQGGGVCVTCSGRDPVAAAIAFRSRVAERGAVVLGEYRNAHTKVHVRCPAGHDCYPTPHDVQRGHGICRTCAGKDPVVAEAAFLKRLAELGATPLYAEWRGTNRGHHVRCACGRESYPRPADVRNGDGICRACAGRDPVAAEAGFRARLAELGAELLEPYKRSGVPHHVRCAAGHDCHPTSGQVRDGCGICRTCSGQDPAVAEANFRDRLAELGAVLLEPYTNSQTPHHVRCGGGHDLYLRPSVVQVARAVGRGICVTCAGKGSAVAEAKFRARLAELSATLLDPEWLGSATPHRVRCAQGHLSRPTPGNVSQGHGVCRFCAGTEWDAFYVVTGSGVVKFGITTGDGRHRLLTHASQGYTEVMRLVTGLPGTVALDAENAVKSALAVAGEKPVRGREYFDASCLALILDVADSWLGAADERAEMIENAAVATVWLQQELFAA